MLKNSVKENTDLAKTDSTITVYSVAARGVLKYLFIQPVSKSVKAVVGIHV
jgi:hypothetical protein